jgi:pyruvate/2-oxoglutarate dehydrogenase complex dihydrolipoamide acyltransferase (E2) component
VAGDRVVELAAGGVTIDLEAPVSGRLVAQFFDEDATVVTGAVIAEFEVAE